MVVLQTSWVHDLARKKIYKQHKIWGPLRKDSASLRELWYQERWDGVVMIISENIVTHLKGFVYFDVTKWIEWSMYGAIFAMIRNIIFRISHPSTPSELDTASLYSG